MKVWISLIVVCMAALVVALGVPLLKSKYGDRILKVAAVPQIEGDRHTIWTEQTLGHTVCTDGKAHLLVMGFRHDGAVVWKIGPLLSEQPAQQ